jgi:hypothetical protein
MTNIEDPAAQEPGADHCLGLKQLLRGRRRAEAAARPCVSAAGCVRHVRETAGGASRQAPTPYLSACRHTVSDCGSTPATLSNSATAPSSTRRARSTYNDRHTMRKRGQQHPW